MLKVEDLSYRYSKNSTDTLKNLDFTISEGEIFGFLGPSGAGKSTTQKILYKLLNGYSGNIEFQGKSLDKWQQDFYEQIGVCFELPNHYLKLTARENLQFFSAFYKNGTKHFDELLDMVGLLEDADKSVSAYSKGMKMRLNFIRALVHDPAFLFLDEPTSGLDPINANKVKNIIKQLKAKSKTIFITTHNMFDADQLCDRVALIYKGEIKALAQPSELKLLHGQKTVKVTRANNPEAIFPINNLAENTEFLKLLKYNDIATIHSQEATLEDVFIKVTGEQLV